MYKILQNSTLKDLIISKKTDKQYLKQNAKIKYIFHKQEKNYKQTTAKRFGNKSLKTSNKQELSITKNI